MIEYPLLYGFVLGLSLAFLIGPVFFTLIKASIQSGFKSGFAVAWGIFISDVVCVAICVFGTAKYLKDESNQAYLAFAGAIMLFAMGAKYLLKPKVNMGDDVKLKALDYIGFFSKGFLVNFINPFVFAVWIGFIGLAYSKYEQASDVCFFLAGILLAILSTDSLKALLAHRIKKWISKKHLKTTYKIVGVCLIGFAFRLAYFFFQNI